MRWSDHSTCLRFTLCYGIFGLLPYISLCGSSKSSLSFVHPSGNNDSFISASNFKKISLLLKGFSSAEKYLLRSTLHSDDVRANSLQWVEGFEWSFAFELFVSPSLQPEQVRSVRRYCRFYPVRNSSPLHPPTHRDFMHQLSLPPPENVPVAHCCFRHLH